MHPILCPAGIYLASYECYITRYVVLLIPRTMRLQVQYMLTRCGNLSSSLLIGTQSALERCPCIRRVATGPPKPRLPAALPHQRDAGGKIHVDRRPKCHVSFPEFVLASASVVACLLPATPALRYTTAFACGSRPRGCLSVFFPSHLSPWNSRLSVPTCNVSVSKLAFSQPVCT